jgi:hypothetical protein
MKLTVPRWVHNLALAAFALLMLFAGLTALFRVR